MYKQLDSSSSWKHGKKLEITTTLNSQVVDIDISTYEANFSHAYILIFDANLAKNAQLWSWEIAHFLQ